MASATCSAIAASSEASSFPYRPGTRLPTFSVPRIFPLIVKGTETAERIPSLEQSGVLDERGRIPEVHRQERLAVIEDPTGAALPPRPFGPDRDDGRRRHGARHPQHLEDVLDGIVEDGARHDRTGSRAAARS